MKEYTMSQNWLLEAEPVDPMGENEIESTVVYTTAAAFQGMANAMWDRMQEDAALACPFQVGDSVVRFRNRQPELLAAIGKVTHIITASCVRVDWGGGGRSSNECLTDGLRKVG